MYSSLIDHAIKYRYKTSMKGTLLIVVPDTIFLIRTFGAHYDYSKASRPMFLIHQ